MKEVRLGIIGIGSMGKVHARSIIEGKVPRCRLAAVCDSTPPAAAEFGDGVEYYNDAARMMASGTIDAVLIATPHYSHTTIGIAALEAGLHVLVEKPISVHKADCERLLSVKRKKKQVFAAMFNQRTDPYYKKVKSLITSGELGEIRRINWIITNWFRTDFYYRSGGWRATWAGEGGGVLLNQCPHNLDLWQWLFGMPESIRAFCSIGRYHNIEVEDDVTAYMTYKNGATGVFITSTGEAPGTNRLEITGERGRVVIENDQLQFIRNEVPMSEFCKTALNGFSRPETWDISIPIHGHGGQHTEILCNFTNAILDGEPLIAPADEGMASVELGNAMILSSFTEKTISLPLDAKAYERFLKKKIASSTYVKPEPIASGKTEDFTKSFGQ